MAVAVLRKPSCEAGALQQLQEMRRNVPGYMALQGGGGTAEQYRSEEEGLQVGGCVCRTKCVPLPPQPACRRLAYACCCIHQRLCVKLLL